MKSFAALKPGAGRLGVFLAATVLLNPLSARGSESLELGFQEAYEMALDHNHEIRIARESVEQGVLLEKQAVTVLFPNLTGNAGYLWQSYPDGEDLDGVTWGLSLTQTIYNGGRVWVAKRGARYTRNAADLGLEFARQSILMDLVYRSNRLLSAEDLLVVANKQVERVDEQLRLARTRLELGDVPRTSVLMAQVALSKAQLDVVSARKEVALSARRLANLIGSGENVRVHVPEIFALPQGSLDELVLLAMERRADLAQARELINVAREEANLVARRDNPNLDLSGSYTRSSEDEFYIPERQVALILTWPFFQGGLVGFQTREALSRVRQAEEAYGQSLQAARLEIEEAILNLESLEAQRELVKSNLLSARENQRLAKARFEVGAAVDLDLLRAEEDLAQAENKEVNFRYDLETARAALLYSVGALDLSAFGPSTRSMDISQ